MAGVTSEQDQRQRVSHSQIAQDDAAEMGCASSGQEAVSGSISLTASVEICPGSRRLPKATSERCCMKAIERYGARWLSGHDLLSACGWRSFMQGVQQRTQLVGCCQESIALHTNSAGIPATPSSPCSSICIIFILSLHVLILSGCCYLIHDPANQGLCTKQPLSSRHAGA